MTRVQCSRPVVADTIAALQRGGRAGEERVVLWLARATAQGPLVPIAEVYEPQQVTAVDYFRLPRASMEALMTHLRTKRFKIVAQVHSHPGRAFHSDVDDEWAIVRHTGALSLVLPDFARDTTVANFLEVAMTYRLSPRNEWLHVPNHGPQTCLEIMF